jgi:hypothetical protein
VTNMLHSCLQVLRKIAAENADALVPHYGAVVPSIVGLLQQTQGPTKLAGDRTLGRVLQVTGLIQHLSLRCESAHLFI